MLNNRNALRRVCRGWSRGTEEIDRKERKMEITIYAKKRMTEDNKPFYAYLSTLTRKDGQKIVVSVKFREECGNPKADRCPMNIYFKKSSANLAKHDYVREDTGEIASSYTLWVSAWEEGTPFVDTSLDDFE